MVEGEAGNYDALPASAVKKQIPIFPKPAPQPFAPAGLLLSESPAAFLFRSAWEYKPGVSRQPGIACFQASPPVRQASAHALISPPPQRSCPVHSDGIPGCPRRSPSPETVAFPLIQLGRLPRSLFRGLLSVHSHYGLHPRQVAMPPFSPEALKITSPPPSLQLLPAGATFAIWDMSPTEGSCLFTAH
jgi:hypothetical protein